jgi:hypothetical protein
MLSNLVKKQHFDVKPLTPANERDVINHQLKRVVLACQISANGIEGKRISLDIRVVYQLSMTFTALAARVQFLCLPAAGTDDD